MLTSEERDYIVVAFNQTRREYPAHLRLHQLFENHALSRPGAPAVLVGDEVTSYAELNRRANQIAHLLISHGTVPGDRIALMLPRTADLVAAMFGVLKAGAAFCPLDPAFASARNQLAIEDCAPRLILSHSSLIAKLPADIAPIVQLDCETEALSSFPGSDPVLSVRADDVCYVIYTSGSTGRPKGVEVMHKGAVNLVCWMHRQFELTHNDCMGALGSVAFDICIPEIFGCLTCGGRLAIGERQVSANGEALANFLLQNEVSMTLLTPTSWSLLLQTGFKTDKLKRITCAESVSQELIEGLLDSSPLAPLYNGYGPTETTVWSTLQRFTSADAPVLIGQPIDNTKIHILDSHTNVCPVGVIGEIHIGGENIAKGYLGLPQQTAEKFIPDPFSTAAGARLYKTGDLGRYRYDGSVQLLGRADTQVKVRGYRVELGEIEQVVAAAPGVTDCVVILHGDRFAAYVVSSDASLDVSAVRAFVEERLPDYMVPVSWMQLREMPITPGGKVDRKNLPAPDFSSTGRRSGQTATTREQIVIAEIWKEVLGIDDVYLDDDFFEVGGHSLSAVTMMAKVCEGFGYEVPLRTLFNAPTLRELTAEVINARHDQALSPVIPIRKTGNKPPLFCVARPNVNALGFVFLSRKFSSDLPVSGLQTTMENDGLIRAFTNEEYESKAAEYVRAMRQIQPSGPYFLVGYCEGAHIAFEMARQLENSNEEVGMVAILDAWPIENTIDRRKFLLHSYGRVVRTFLKSDNRRRWRMIVRKFKGLPALEPQNLAIRRKLVRDPDADPQTGRVASRDPERYWPGKDFIPTKIAGKVTVFRVERQAHYRIKDEALGWGARARGGVDTIHVPGSHALILRDPAVSIIAREMEKRIDAYLDSKASTFSYMAVAR